MIKGIGVDLIEVERIAKSVVKLGDRFLSRLFHPEELAPFASHKERNVHIAGRFAAKEAIAKALGTGFGEKLGWLDIIIDKEASGKPTATLSKKGQKTFGKLKIHISISHTKSNATAFAIVETK
jgi:holo-[acyl-carrier protein] synthase